ncbi:MAG: hypothetical protein MUF43_12475 [Flavobacterium sp.]|nr:hypothetical protein [Flavobacterium sp.]
MKYWILLCLVFSFFTIDAQNYSQVVLTDIPFEPSLIIKKDIKEKLEGNPIYKDLDHLSKSFIYWTNYARLYPREFRDSALIPFLNQQPVLKGKYANSLIETLSNLEPIPCLDPEPKLTLAANNHAKDI